MTVPKPGKVERAVRSQLRSLGCSVQADGLGALAVELATQMDTPAGTAAHAAQLRLILADLAGTYASRPRKDTLDELNARRAVKRAAEG